MNPFSLLSFIAVAAYLYFGVYLLLRDRRSPTSIVFFLLCVGCAGWSFPYIFAHAATTAAEYMRWYRFAVVSSTVLPPLTLHFLLRLTGRPSAATRRWLAPLVYLPVIPFFWRAATGPLFATGVIRGPWGWLEVVSLSEPWTAAFVAYYVTCSAVGLALCLAWGRRSTAA